MLGRKKPHLRYGLASGMPYTSEARVSYFWKAPAGQHWTDGYRLSAFISRATLMGTIWRVAGLRRPAHVALAWRPGLTQLSFCI